MHVTKKELHSLIGKINHCAGLLLAIRPFLQPLWAALADKRHTGAPRECIWKQQIAVELDWFELFFTGRGLAIERVFTIEAFLRLGTKVEIGTDASPWGMGGWLTVDGHYTHYFAVPITPADAKLYGVEIGTAAGQQIWECLAVLVAIDMWAAVWNQHRIILQIRSDNVTALTALVKMRPKTEGVGMIVRELAMRLVEMSFPPDAYHTPGISHVIADRLSRVFAPDGDGVVANALHPALAHATLSTPPERTKQWYKAYK